MTYRWGCEAYRQCHGVTSASSARTPCNGNRNLPAEPLTSPRVLPGPLPEASARSLLQVWRARCQLGLGSATGGHAQRERTVCPACLCVSESLLTPLLSAAHRIGSHAVMARTEPSRCRGPAFHGLPFPLCFVLENTAFPQPH